MRSGPGKLKPATDIEAAAGTASTLLGAINHDIVLDFVLRSPKEINLTSVLESDLSGWLSKQTESISVRGALLPFLKDLLDPLKCYDSSDAFIQALRPHVFPLLGLKIYGWVQNNTVSREEIRGELGQLITVAIKHLHAYRDLYAPEVSAAAEAPSQSYEPARVENQSDRGLQQEAEPSLDQLWDSIDSKLRSQGIEQPLAALVATKTIAALRRHVSIIEQAESTPLYRVKFIESWSGILDVSERFDISPDRILSLGHSRYNSATIAEAYAKQNSVQSDTHIAGFKSTDSRRLLNTAIEDYRANCPSLESHCDETLRNYPNEKQLLAVHLFEMVLYSTTMAVPALEQLNKLQKSLQLSYQNLCDILSNQASEHTKSVVTSIREVGKMTFADYMKLCLYDSEHGYYVRPRNEVIPRTEFITLPEKYTDFGRAVAHDLFQRWKAMGSPQSYDVIEMGAGSGKLACDFLDEIAAKGINDAEWRAFEAAVRYKIVEISARGCSADGARTMRDLQEQTLADHSSKVSWVAATADSLETVFAPASVTGAFISNELPDAFPVHVVRRINGRLCELYVHEQDGYLVEEYGPPSTPEVEAFVEQHGITLREGETGVVNLQAQAWVRSMAAILKEGAIITYDYGATPGFHTQLSSLKSEIRTYGTKRKLSEQRLFGVSGNDVVLGEFEAMMSNLQCKLGRENALAAFADRFTRKQSTDEPAVFDLCEEERHKRTAFFMRELAASALHCPGEVDITTDADFLSMQMQARRSGLEPRAVVTQSEYLQRLSFEANNREIYFENESFRVQVFDKSPVSQPRPRQVSVSYAEEAVLEQNCVTNSIELKTLLELVARADLAGLGKCGELWLAHIKRNGVDSIGVKWGSSLVILLRELAVKAPTGSLVGDLEQYSLSIPKVDPRAPFKEVSEAALQRAIKIRTLGAVIEARLLDAFIDLGYRHISPGADTAILELLSNKPITELEELAYSAEPQASLDRLGALYEAVSIKDPARIEPLRIHDLFSRRDGGVDFDGRKALAPLLPLAGINDFADLVSMVRNLGTHQGPVGVCVDLIANPSLEKFVKVRQLLLGVLTDRLAGRLDPLPQSVIENTVLGPRSSCIHGNPDAIETQPENTRNIAFIFGRFGAYVGHGLRYGGDKFELRKQTAYLRLLDHSRDAEALQAALKEGVGSRYSDELHDEKLLRLLLEKGFKKAAEEYVASWRLEDYYFTPEVIELLDAHGLSQAVQRFLSHQRDQLSPRRNNSFSENIELLFDRLSDPEEAAKQFQLEWSHVKTLLRVLCAGKKASSQVGRGRIATREMASACRSGELTINSQDDSWDIFRPDNLPQDRMIIGVNDRIEGDRKYLWQFTSFIRKGLNHETLKGRAIDCIREMAPSLMKLTLLGEASLALPAGWGQAERESFLTEWMTTLDACAEQIAQSHCIEQGEEFPLLWDPRYRVPEEIDANRGLVPDSGYKSRLIRTHLGTMLTWGTEQVAAGKLAGSSAALRSVNQAFQPIYSQPVLCIRYDWVDSTSHTKAFFFGGNHYALTKAQTHLRGVAIDADTMSGLIESIRMPDKSMFFGWPRPIQEDDAWYNYNLDVQEYFAAQRMLYQLAVRDGHGRHAQKIEEAMRESLSQYNEVIGQRSYRLGSDKEAGREADALWELHSAVCKCVYAEVPQRTQLIADVMDRINADTRGFFTETAITRTAEWLTRQDTCKDAAIELFMISIDRLAARRGQNNWLPKQLAQSLKGAALTDLERDSLIVKAIETIWPEERHPLHKLLYVGHSVSQGQELLLDVIEHSERTPKSYTLLLSKLKDAVELLDPTRHGSGINEVVLSCELTAALQGFVASKLPHYRYDADTKRLIRTGRILYEEIEPLKRALQEGERAAVDRVSLASDCMDLRMFNMEYAALELICSKLRARADIWDPKNFDRVVGTFNSKGDAVSAMRAVTPEQALSLEATIRNSAFPSAEVIASGDFNPENLRESLEHALSSAQNPGWLDAARALNAWFTHDVINRYNQARRANDGASPGKQRHVFMDDAQCRGLLSFEVLQCHLRDWLMAADHDPLICEALSDLLSGESAEAVQAKAFIAFEVLRLATASSEIQDRAFRMLGSTYFPPYLMQVYEQSFKNAEDQSRRDFFLKVAQWDQTVPVDERPSVIWAHLFEEESDRRQELFDKLCRYRVDVSAWHPDLLDPDDWVILHHHMNSDRYRRVHFSHYATGVAYLNSVENSTMQELIITLLADSDRDRFIIEKLLQYWCESIFEPNINELFEEYKTTLSAEVPQEETFEVFDGLLSKWREYFERVRSFIGNNEGPEPARRQSPQWPDLAALEIFRVFDPTTDRGGGLAMLLERRFPSLSSDSRQELVALARNPFKVEDLGTKEAGWWTQSGFYFNGERNFHKRIEQLGESLSDEEQEALIRVMYPYSKSYFLNHQRVLREQFPQQLPAAACASGSDSWPNGEISSLVLEIFVNARTPINAALMQEMVRAARLELARNFSLQHGPVAAIATDLSRAARVHLGRRHTQDIAEVKLPTSFATYPKFARFVIQSYLGIVHVGLLETLGDRLKGLSPDDALREFFRVTEQSKVGQMLRARPELPHRFRDTLRDVEDRVPESDQAEVENTISRTLRWNPSAFRLLHCIAAGSIGEVWAAEHTRFDYPLAIKVLTPTKLERTRSVLAELGRMREILGWYQDISRESVIAARVTDKLIALIRSETDFRNDMRNWRDMMGNQDVDMSRLRDDGIVPLPGGEFWTPNYIEASPEVLVMSMVDGVGLNDISETVRDTPVGKFCASKLWDFFYDSLFNSESGGYPMDLHLGNSLMLRSELPSLSRHGFRPTMVCVDTGQMGRITTAEREAIQQFLGLAVVDPDPDKILDLMGRFGSDSEGRRGAKAQYNRAGLHRCIQALAGTHNPMDGLGLLVGVDAFMHGLDLGPFVDPVKAFNTVRGAIVRLDSGFKI